MKQILKGSLILLSIVCFVIGCKKSIDEPKTTEEKNTPNDTSNTAVIVPFPQTPVPECNLAPYYGDSIVFTQPTSSSDFYIYPQNNEGIAGTYLSWPQGLAMNANTGSINLTQSETGLRYAVGFVKAGTTDTCVSQFIVGGASYMDSVYVLSHSDTTSAPYFNANPYLPSPCHRGGGPANECQFDYNDYAKKQGIEVDKATGFIDLKKTIKGPKFSKLSNGQSILTTIYYKLNDPSNKAPQQLDLNFIYYDRKSDIPAAILAQVTQNINNTFGNLLISKGPSPRPPLIIIVRDN